jgi:hypothetical protein
MLPGEHTRSDRPNWRPAETVEEYLFNVGEGLEINRRQPPSMVTAEWRHREESKMTIDCAFYGFLAADADLPTLAIDSPEGGERAAACRRLAPAATPIAAREPARS